jgi:hypothetical protein
VKFGTATSFTFIHIGYEVPFVRQQIMNIRIHWARSAVFKVKVKVPVTDPKAQRGS